MLVWAIAEVQMLTNRKRRDELARLAALRGLHWSEFERLLCEGFRRAGYAVEDSERDGDVEIRLQRGFERKLVQYKHWQKDLVGVAAVSELLGRITSEGAHRGIVIVSGGLTWEALDFLEKNSAQLQLIDADRLLKLIEGFELPSNKPST